MSPVVCSFNPGLVTHTHLHPRAHTHTCTCAHTRAHAHTHTNTQNTVKAQKSTQSPTTKKNLTFIFLCCSIIKLKSLWTEVYWQLCLVLEQIFTEMCSDLLVSRTEGISVVENRTLAHVFCGKRLWNITAGRLKQSSVFRYNSTFGLNSREKDKWILKSVDEFCFLLNRAVESDRRWAHRRFTEKLLQTTSRNPGRIRSVPKTEKYMSSWTEESLKY